MHRVILVLVPLLVSAVALSVALAVSSDCTLGRSLTEGLAGCLGDVAGGYCTFASCDIVARPDLRTDYDSRMKIVKVGE